MLYKLSPIACNLLKLAFFIQHSTLKIHSICASLVPFFLLLSTVPLNGCADNGLLTIHQLKDTEIVSSLGLLQTNNIN